jgi:hypothetical protein
MSLEIKELDAVALTCDLPNYGLKRGDIGTAVLVHGNGEAFEVEFIDYDGHTVALVTLEGSQVRALHAGDLPHARELTVA